MEGSYAIGHQLGLLDVPHDVMSCIVCPAVMKFNVEYGAGNPVPLMEVAQVEEILIMVQ